MDQVKRVNYFQGMMLVDEDFRDEQTYHRQARHNHNLELHAWGVVRGLEVSVKGGALDVTEGLALDANGKEIWWQGGAATAAGKPDDGVYLVIEWNEEPSDEYSQMAGKYLRLTDTCKFSFKKAAEANDVVLAKVSVQEGQIQERPDNSGRRTASSVRANGGDLEIRPVASNGSLRLMTGAPSTARLGIDAKGNVGIGTPPTAARLSIDAPPYEGTLMDFSVGEIYKLRLGYGSFERDTVSYHFDLKNNTGEFNKFLVFHKGNVGIENNLSVKGVLSVKGALSAKGGVTFRVNADDSPDPNHGISYFGAGAKDAVGEFGFDGPVLYGYSGGALGTFREKKEDKKVALRWNDQGNVGIGTTDPKAKLDVQGAANIWSGERFAVPNGLMAPGSLTIGNIKANFGGGTTWNNNNPAALLLETLDNTEIAVHDSGRRLASLMYYEGGDVNRITIGRQMDPSWGAISTLALNGNVGIGTSNPAHKLDVYGAQGNYPGKVATSDGYMRFGPVNGGWCHFDTDRPRYYFSTGVTVNGSIGSYGDGDLNLQTGDYTRLTINRGSGYVGIGKSDPQVPLDVSGARNYPLNASPDGFGPNTGFINWGDRGTNFDLSILASHWIGGAGFVANSDRRIKEIVGHSDTRKDLEIIQKLRVTEYHPLDKMAEGDSLRRGFIGQEVAEVLPQAVASRTNFIPDIYSKATDFAFDPDQKTLSIALPKPHALTKGEVVQILTEDAAKTVNVLEVSTPTSFVVGEFEKEPQLVFVYGRQVDDFLAVHYEQIFTTAVGAIQELKKEKDEEVKALRTEMSELKAANDDLTKRLQLLESKMASTPSVVIAKNGSSGSGRQ